MTISQWPTFVGIFEMLTGLHFLRENVVVYARWRFLISLQKPKSHDKQPA